MRLNLKEFGAVLCDLDGVITQTARLHAAAWKRLFDDYLQELAARTGSPFKPFDLEEDYRVYVDGKPRHEGVRDFLASRKVSLPPGTPSDGSDRETLYGLGQRKDKHFKVALRETESMAMKLIVCSWQGSPLQILSSRLLEGWLLNRGVGS